MRRMLPLLTGVVILALVALTAAFVIWKWGSDAADPSSHHTTRIKVSIGESASSVGSDLAGKGLIRSEFVFSLLNHGQAFHSGVYDLSAAETPRRILKQLQHGDFATIKVTIPEGWTARKIAHRLLRVGAIDDEAKFYNLVTTQGAAFHASVPLPVNLEGYLFPDTYRIPIGASKTQIVQMMIDNFDRRVGRPYGSSVIAISQSMNDTLTIASMIEAEAETDADRAPIAGVIYNRLARKMRLQIDATVEYALPEHKTRLLDSDLAVDSPYNTYRIFGVPPGPIDNPGLPSIEAAFHPAQSDFLYYVDGPHHRPIFARTFAEHAHNVALIRQQEKQAQKTKTIKVAAPVEAP